MPSRRASDGVLRNFLGAYSSRNSDYDGYWIFGLVVTASTRVSIDLLGEGCGAGMLPYETAARQLACAKFKEQISAARVPLSAVAEARLDLTWSTAARVEPVNGHDREGHDLTLTVRATTRRGRLHRQQRTIFVAPHDPTLELRSTRATLEKRPSS